MTISTVRQRFSISAPRGAACPAALLAGVLAAACGTGPDGAGLPALETPREVPSPAATGAAEPFLAPARNGDVLLSWLEPAGDDSYALRFSRSTANGWTDPRTIVSGNDFFVNWADFPSILELPDGTLAAHWLQRTGEERYAYAVRVSRSTDGGETWSAPVTPHRDETPTEHGFVSLFEARDGLGAVWLDGRNFAVVPGADVEPTREMTLRYATIAKDGTLLDEAELDGRTCECCQTDAAPTSGGAVVVYRDRSESEVRDISITRLAEGRWSPPVRVHDDGWVFPGCPVNGPAIGARNEQVAVAWFTAADDSPRVLLAFSADGGRTFDAPLRIDDGNPAGRVDLLLVDDALAIVSWLERDENGASVRSRVADRTRGAGPGIVVAASSDERASGFPRMSRAGDELYFAWTDVASPSRVRVAKTRLPAR